MKSVNQMNSSKPANAECSHFKTCSGCIIPLREDPPLLKTAREYFLSKGIKDVPFIREEGKYWRVRSKLAVRGTAHNPQIGLFQKGSHKVISIPKCLVHHPKINEAAHKLYEGIKKNQIEPYDEIGKKGLLRYIQCVVERASGKVQLTLVVNTIPSKNEKILSFAKELEDSEFWHSIWINYNNSPLNTIFGNEWEKVCGESYLWEDFNEVSVCFSPASFGQANLELFEKMLLRINKEVPMHSKVVELYAGVGAIGLSIASKVKSLTCIEINREAEKMFLTSIKKMKDTSQLSYKTADVLEHLNLVEDADVIIVDPPRKGVEDRVLLALCSGIKRQTLIYISCGFDSFQRDSEKLIQGGWKLKSAELYFFFPGSDHLETLAIYSKGI